jgi:hypothetical protein
MNLEKIIESLQAQVLTSPGDFTHRMVSSGYASDLLSCVLTGAASGGIWLTLQSHMNIVAVASMLDLSAVIITSGSEPEPETIARANEQGVILLATSLSTFEAVGRLWELGLRAS